MNRYVVMGDGVAFGLFFFFSSRRRHTRCALVTGVQTCALPILAVTTGLLPAGASDREKAGAVAMLQKNIKVVPQQDNIFEVTSSIGVGSLSDRKSVV